MKYLPSTIRAVFFDAVGTLLHPEPSAADAYAIIGSRFGSRLARSTITARFRAAFRRHEELDRAVGHATSEEREVNRWRSIVAEVLDDVEDSAGCFGALYDHFSRPDSWRLEPDCAPTLRELAERGLVLGLCSNFDHRLRGLVAAAPELAEVRHLVISSEVGWKKPAAEFFAAVTHAAALFPEKILIVGDDRGNDFDGARAAGLSALLFDPRSTSDLAPKDRITRLSDLIR